MNFILDNLIAEGKAKPMIVVMDNGGSGGFGGRRPGPGVPGSVPAAGGSAAAPAGGPARGRGGVGSGGSFERIVIGELIPMIDSTYRTLSDREHRAMAGLSMGAGQTVNITMNNLDKFAHIGGFSGGGGGDPKTAHNGAMADAAAFNRKVKVLFFSIGTAEGAARVRSYHEQLDAAGIKNIFYESPGTAHEWQTWRRSLHEFAPLLFQNATKTDEAKTTAPSTYTNPLPVTIGDPYVLREPGRYYMYGSGGGRGQSQTAYPAFTSTDLVEWKSLGDSLTRNTADSWCTGMFWAP